jgi:tetratricopeptide (TPR) repeat protein
MPDSHPTMSPLFPGGPAVPPRTGDQARSAPPRTADALRRRLPLLVIPIAGAAMLALGAWLALGARETIAWIEPIALPVNTLEPTPAEFADRLAAATNALAARARGLDELAFAEEPFHAQTARGPAAHATRVARRLASIPDLRIVGEVTRAPEHVDILVRDEATTLRSRVANGPDAIDRVIAPGAHNLLLIASPADAATLALHDNALLADAGRLDVVMSVLVRHKSLADDPRTIALRGAQAAAHGRCKEALAMFDSVIAARPDWPRAHVFAGDCHARLGQRDVALERIARAAELARDNAGALTLAGAAYRRIGYPARSLEVLRVAHLKDGTSEETRIAIGETLLALHRPAEALAWLEAHPVEGARRARWLAVLGLAQVRAGHGPAAEASVATLRGHDGMSIDALRVEAELAAATKAWPQALGRYNALRLTLPADGAARAGEGYALLALQRANDAIAAFQACASVAPWLADCRLGLGMALREADRADEALAPLIEAAELDALDPRIPNETARTLRALVRRDDAAPYAARAELLSRRLQVKLALP